MKTVATVMQLTRSLLILTPAEYDKQEGGLGMGKKRTSSMPTNFSVPQIFELNDSLKERPFEKSEELAAFVKRCAESVSMELGDLFICIEDEDVLITKEYKHAVENKEKLLLVFAKVEAEAVLHQEVDKYTILNFEYGQQYGKSNKSEDVSASLFAMNTGMLTDIRANFSAAGLRIVKIVPPIAGMLYTAKSDVNSATRAIAVISMDFAATRLVVLHNGAPVFQQSFSSVLEDIAELFMLEFGISKLGAIDLIRQEGLGVCNKCNSATTRKQTMTMLDNAAGEILRNLRMVISTMRLDIDQIVLCDALAKIPNISAYCRQVGLTAPMENIMNLFSGGSLPPTVTESAKERGFAPVSFITLNGVLTMPVNEANLLQGETNIMAALSSEGSNKLGNFAASVLGVVAAVWVLGVSGWWFALEMQKNNDANELQNPNFTRAQQLIDDEAKYSALVENVAVDLETLPQTENKSSVVVNHVYDEIVKKAQNFDSIAVVKNNVEGVDTITANVSFAVKDYNSFVDLKNSIADAGFFNVSEQLTVSKRTRGDSTNLVSYYQCEMNFTVSESGMEQAALTDSELAARDARLQKAVEEGSDSKDKGKTSESSSSSKSEESSAVKA